MIEIENGKVMIDGHAISEERLVQLAEKAEKWDELQKAIFKEGDS